MSKAEELDRMLQILPVEQQAATLRFIVGWVSNRPEFSVVEEGIIFYLKESKLGPFKE